MKYLLRKLTEERDSGPVNWKYIRHTKKVNRQMIFSYILTTNIQKQLLLKNKCIKDRDKLKLYMVR